MIRPMPRSRRKRGASRGGASSCSSSTCLEPALILEEAAQELEEEMRREREAEARRLDRILDDCWSEMVREMHR